MEEASYFLKSRTTWTLAQWFQDPNYWKESLLIDGVPPSLSLIKEYDVQSELVIRKGILIDRGKADESLSARAQQNSNKKEADPSTSNVHLQAFSSQKDQASCSTSHQMKGHTCRTCEKFQKSELVQHYSTHSDDKPFACFHYGKFFAQNGNLQNGNQHPNFSGVKYYNCSHCSFSCLRRCDLNRHLLTHTEEMPFHCDVCNKYFPHSSHLIRHQRTHSNEKPFTCSTCEKSFAQKVHLKSHLLTHTKEKPHKCEHCGKGFALKSDLKTHTRIHTGEKPYNCQTCDKSFASRSHRNYHSRSCTSATTMKMTLD